MKIWKEDSEFRYYPNITMAENIVRSYLYNELGKTCDVYIVWQCYILANRKYLIATVDNDQLYFEVTYSEKKDEWHLDVYDKKQNFALDYTSCEEIIVKEQHDYDL